MKILSKKIASSPKQEHSSKKFSTFLQHRKFTVETSGSFFLCRWPLSGLSLSFDMSDLHTCNKLVNFQVIVWTSGKFTRSFKELQNMLNHISCYGSQHLFTPPHSYPCTMPSMVKGSHLGETYGDCRADVCAIPFKYFTLTDLKTHTKK